MTPSSQLRVISGAPATGKSTRLLAVLRQALEQRDWTVRLLVPSATMAEHMRNQLAREGFVLRKNTVSTLTRFVDQLELADPAPAPAQLEAIIVQVLKERCPADYQAVASQPGFHRHLASTVDALALAGVNPKQLEGPLADIYHRILRSLDKQQLALRGHRLAQAEELLKPTHLTGVTHLLLDGFFSFSNTERAFLDKLGTLIRLDLTEPVRASLEHPAHRQPVTRVLAASDQSHEALLIAAEILRLAEAGVELRRIGILLRNPDSYAALIESTLDRLDIPSRSYLGTALAEHPLIAFHRAMIEAVASDWENAAVLSALRWRFTGLGGTPAGDTLETQVRSALPSNSLELFAQLQPFADLPGKKLSALEAASVLKRFATLLEAPKNLEPALAAAWLWHQRGAALQSLHQIIDESAAQIEPDATLTLESFWNYVESNLNGMVLHERDTRRNVVHVMDLFESRQWDLDYIFAPGLSGEEFPKRYSPDPLLTEHLKKTFGMKTLEDRNNEEHFLYEMLLSRASKELTLSYPLINAKGDPVLPSTLLEQQPAFAPPVSIHSVPPRFEPASGQLSRGYRAPRQWSASEFETYLNCPWRHFASRGLELKGLPELPPERLNPILLGVVAHETITIWTRDPSKNIEAIAERQLVRACREQRVPPGYHYERERINLLRNLRLYASNAPPIPPGWRTHLEQRFEFQLENGPAVRGQIDRYDQSPSGEIHAYDFKYSKSKGLEEKYPIQGALYALALGEQVTRFSFIAVRDQARPALLEAATLKSSIDVAKGMIESIVEGVAAGRIPLNPRNRDNCQYCDFIDACRIRTRSEEEEAPAAFTAGEQA